MLEIKIIAVGNMKEQYYREACAEYHKRLGAFGRVEMCELKETRLPEDPSPSQITAALSDEAEKIRAAIPPRSYVVALCVEGKSFSSPALAERIEGAMGTHSSLCFIIGSSFGLDEEIKRSADLRLSLSEMTFPHRLFRVMLYETIYRSFSIIKGMKYHK